MRRVQLPGTPLAVSKFIFGTASLIKSGGLEERQKLLFAAADAGFTHFDTAPYYGFGLSERELAPLLSARPDVTVTTKVGLYSPGGEDQGHAAAFLRKAAGRLYAPIARPTFDFSIARARRSLEASLLRLGRERIDIYALHEPSIGLLDSDEWQAWLEQCVREGKVGTFGLALIASQLEPFLKAQSPLAPLIQLGDSLDAREADMLARYDRPMQITYGYVSAARRAATPLAAEQVIREALRRNREGAIIVTTTKAERMAQYAELAAETPDAP